MKKLSLCMIVKNEEKVLERCLNSVKKLVDEIIIVDTGSTDSTKNIAKKFTNKIYDFDWCDDFSKARNYSFSKAKFEYIMWLDADDVITKKNLNQLLKLKENLCADTYMLKYNLYTNKKTLSMSFYRERILKKSKLCMWEGCVHECIAPYGSIVYLPIAVAHKKTEIKDSKRNLKIYNKIIKTRELNTRELYYFARELKDNKYYKKSNLYFKKFLKRNDTWMENRVDAYINIAINYMSLKNYNKARETLFIILNFATLSPKIACLIGDTFLYNRLYKLAIHWYLLSIKINYVPNKLEFYEKYYQNYYPYLQLCVCYYKLNNINKSIKYNTLASKYYKTETTEKNKIFLQSLLVKNNKSK